MLSLFFVFSFLVVHTEYIYICKCMYTIMYFYVQVMPIFLHYAHLSYRHKTIFSGELRNKVTLFVFLTVKHLAGIEMKNINLETLYKNIGIFLALSNFLAHIPWQQILFLNERYFFIRI